MSESYQVKPIGIVEKAGHISEIQIYPEYQKGLAAVTDFKKLMILFWLHLRDKPKDRSRMMTGRKRHGKPGYRGVFATHSPYRPNPIGVTTVDLVKVEEGRLFIRGFDGFEETPILDIKSG